MSLSKPVFATISLGSSKHSFSVQILKFLCSDAPLLDKVQDFAYFDEVLCQHEHQLTSLAIQQAYDNNIPVSSSAAASEEANHIGSEFHEVFFLVSNLSCLGFFRSDGTSQYLALIPLLPASHMNIWDINLFTQFWAALGEDLTRRIARLPRYLAIHLLT
jgi:hypothetical protein